MSDGPENWKGLGGDDVAEVLLEPHGQLDGVQGVQAVLVEGAVEGDCLFVCSSEVVLDDVDNVSRKG